MSTAIFMDYGKQIDKDKTVGKLMGRQVRELYCFIEKLLLEYSAILDIFTNLF